MGPAGRITPRLCVWFYKAAEHGSNDAEENIGYIFQNGLGVQTNYAMAMSGSSKLRRAATATQKIRLVGCISSARA